MSLDCTAALNWLFTVGVHGLIWAAVALFAGAALRQRALAWQEALLRLALLGGLSTGSLQWALGGPIAEASAWSLPTAATAAVGPVETPPQAFVLPSRREAMPLPAEPRRGGDRRPAIGSPATPMRGDAAAGLTPAQLAVAAAIGCALVGLGAFLRARRRLYQCIASRRPETDPRVLAAAARMAQRLGLPQTPNLSRCERLASPVAFGLLRPEICLPARTEELGEDELQALFGHELAHICRNDAFWLLCGALVQALFPWQLWLLPVRRRLCALAELRADGTAAAATSGLALANCLVQVAAWVGERRLPTAAMAMAARPSLLRLRVERALADRLDRALPRAAACVGGVALAALLTAMAPGVRPESVAVRPVSRSGSPPSEPLSPTGPRRSDAGPAPIAAPAPPRAASEPAAAASPFAVSAEVLDRELAELAAAAAAELAAGADAPPDEEAAMLRRLLAIRLENLQQLGAELTNELRRQQGSVSTDQPATRRSR